jgi:hypothetical protein
MHQPFRYSNVFGFVTHLYIMYVWFFTLIKLCLIIFNLIKLNLNKCGVSQCYRLGSIRCMGQDSVLASVYGLQAERV